MARSTYTGGTATLTITVEHTWGSDESTARVDARRINGLPLIPFTVPADPDILRELGQALIGAADEFSPEPEDDVTEPEDEADHRGATGAERRVLAALSGTQPRTPADLKRRMPGATPVATIRSLLDSLRVKGLAAVRMIPGGTGTTTTWVSIGAGVAYSDAERQASLEAAQAASQPEAPEDTGLPLTTAERAVWYALRRSSGRTVATVAKAVERSERHTQALLESLEAQGYARQYESDAFGTLWRVAI